MKSGKNTLRRWLPDMDANRDKQIQSLCYKHYTIRQTGRELY